MGSITVPALHMRELWHREVTSGWPYIRISVSVIFEIGSHWCPKVELQE
jgi:hypothetical protein